MSKTVSNMTDAELAAFNTNFRAVVSPTPLVWGLSAPEMAAYGVVADIWEEKYSIAITPSTRTSIAIEGKNEARKNLEVQAAALIMKINGTLSVSDEQRMQIGIPIRKPAEPIGVPTTAPIPSVVKVVGKTIFAKFSGQGVEGGGKPAGCESVLVFSYQGNEPLPEAITDWTYQGSTTSNKAEITMGASAPAGSKVYLTACWQNPRRACGPLSSPIFTFLGGGPVIQAA